MVETGVCLEYTIRDGAVGALKAERDAVEALLDSTRLDGADRQHCRSIGRIVDAIVVVVQISSNEAVGDSIVTM